MATVGFKGLIERAITTNVKIAYKNMYQSHQLIAEVKPLQYRSNQQSAILYKRTACTVGLQANWNNIQVP